MTIRRTDLPVSRLGNVFGYHFLLDRREKYVARHPNTKGLGIYLCQRFFNPSSVLSVCQAVTYDSVRNYEWVGKSKGLYYLDLNEPKENWKLKKATFFNEIIINNYILDIYLDDSGKIWLSSAEGTIVLEETKNKDKAFLVAGTRYFKTYCVLHRFEFAYLHQKTRQDSKGNSLISTWGVV